MLSGMAATNANPARLPKQLLRRVEGKQSVNGPGLAVYTALARHIVPTTVRFADLGVDWERTTPESRSGRILVVTDSAVIFVDYDNIAGSDAPGAVEAGAGRLDVTWHSKAAEPVESIRWAARRLDAGDDGSSVRTSWLDARSITVTGRGWSIELPSERTADADDYVSRLTTAMGLD
jgi:hypothetical protein